MQWPWKLLKTLHREARGDAAIHARHQVMDCHGLRPRKDGPRACCFATVTPRPLSLTGRFPVVVGPGGRKTKAAVQGQRRGVVRFYLQKRAGNAALAGQVGKNRQQGRA